MARKSVSCVLPSQKAFVPYHVSKDSKLSDVIAQVAADQCIDRVFMNGSISANQSASRPLNAFNYKKFGAAIPTLVGNSKDLQSFLLSESIKSAQANKSNPMLRAVYINFVTKNPKNNKSPNTVLKTRQVAAVQTEELKQETKTKEISYGRYNVQFVATALSFNLSNSEDEISCLSG